MSDNGDDSKVTPLPLSKDDMQGEGKDGPPSRRFGNTQRALGSSLVSMAVMAAVAPAYVHVLIIIGKWSWNLWGM